MLRFIRQLRCPCGPQLAWLSLWVQHMPEVNPPAASRSQHSLLRSAWRTAAAPALRSPAAAPVLRGISVAADKIVPTFRYPSSRPTATEVLANYSRGMVLFGRSNSRMAPFVWDRFPMRTIITKENAKVPVSVRRYRRHSELKVRFNENFEEIIYQCSVGRTEWLTPELISIYLEVHELGFTAAVGTYRDDQLVGGLWGLAVGRVVSVYSMFHRENHAGTFAFAALTESITDDGQWSIIDCGVPNAHAARYGAAEVSREKFCELLWKGLNHP